MTGGSNGLWDKQEAMLTGIDIGATEVTGLGIPIEDADWVIMRQHFTFSDSDPRPSHALYKKVPRPNTTVWHLQNLPKGVTPKKAAFQNQCTLKTLRTRHEAFFADKAFHS